MPQITAAAFKAVFTATSRASDPEVKWALRGGLKLLREYVGTEAVADYIAENPVNEDRADDLEMAHAHLSYGVLGLNVGSRLREGGIILSETQIEDDAKNTYLPPEDVEKFVAQHEAKAMQFIGVHLIAATERSGGVEFCHPAAVGCGDC
jgi:hypothetical protein